LQDFLAEHLHEVIAGAVTMILTIGIVGVSLLQVRTPDGLWQGWLVAMGYTFGSGTSKALAAKRATSRRKATGPAKP